MNRTTALAALALLPLQASTLEGLRGHRATQVLVVNPASRPVPTQVQGPVTIQGAVTVGNVPDVNVVGMPPVTLANSPTVTIGDAVGVHDLDAAHREPVTISLNGDIPAGQGQIACPATLYSVPAGKRLVIEYVGSWAVSQLVQSATLGITPVTPGPNDFPFFFERKGTSQIGHALYSITQPTRLYSAVGGVVSYCVSRSNEAAFADFYSYRLRLSGFLVDAS